MKNKKDSNRYIISCLTVVMVSLLLFFVSCPVKNSIADVLNLPISKTLNPSKSVSSASYKTCNIYRHYIVKQVKSVKKAEVLLPFKLSVFNDSLLFVNKPVEVYKQGHLDSTSKIPLYILYKNIKDFIV